MFFKYRHNRIQSEPALFNAQQVGNPCVSIPRLLLFYLFLLAALPAHGETGTRQQSTRSAADTQAIQNEAIELIGRLQQLEEELFYPAHTRVAVFLSVADNTTVVPRAISLAVNNSKVADHVYTDAEISALKTGGIQRLYTGNIRMGNHVLRVRLDQAQQGGTARKRELTYKFNKDEMAENIEIVIGAGKQPVVIESRN